MSLRRKTGARAARYRGEYLSSPAWWERRRVWFETVAAAGQVAVCQVCGADYELKSLDLHHTSYEGVTQDGEGAWVAGEAHEDLMPLCREDHEMIHREFDVRGRDFRGWDRRHATAVVVIGLRRRRSDEATTMGDECES